MGTTGDRSGDVSGTPSVKTIDLKLEVVVIPVSDGDRAKGSYGGLGAARRRLPLRQRLPDRPVHAARLGHLDPVRYRPDLGRARRGPEPVCT